VNTNNDNIKELVDDLDKRTARIGEEVKVISVQAREAHRGFIETYAQIKWFEKTLEENRGRMDKSESNDLLILGKINSLYKWAFGLVMTGIGLILTIIKFGIK
jgi:hypothetical protein